MTLRTEKVDDLRLGMYVDVASMVVEPKFGYIHPGLEAAAKEAEYRYGEIVTYKETGYSFTRRNAPTEEIRVIEVGVRFRYEDEAVHRFRIPHDTDVDVKT